MGRGSAIGTCCPGIVSTTSFFAKIVSLRLKLTLSIIVPLLFWTRE